jgi:hypothetical protein
VTTPLCASGLDMQKYITVLATRGVAVGLAPLHGIVCTHKGHAEKAYGTTTAVGLPAARLSGRYPYVFCVVLSCAHLELAPPGVDTSGVSPMVVPVAVGLRANHRDLVAALPSASTKADADGATALVRPGCACEAVRFGAMARATTSAPPALLAAIHTGSGSPPRWPPGWHPVASAYCTGCRDPPRVVAGIRHLNPPLVLTRRRDGMLTCLMRAAAFEAPL